MGKINSRRICKNVISCKRYRNSPDFSIIEPDGNSIKIEQIREFQKKVSEKPIISNKKVYIINDSDKMTVEAQKLFIKNTRRTTRICYYNFNWFKRKFIFKYHKIKMYDTALL